jgi:hypothetical protein
VSCCDARAAHEELKLDDPAWTDDQLLDVVVAHPTLMNRPVVVTPLGTRLCRPSEVVLDILPSPQLAPFAKEDRKPVMDAKGASAPLLHDLNSKPTSRDADRRRRCLQTEVG